jgi:phenylpropionate dioxygenase-like ring-hydroxylating dioxygenase large terminal subunit
LVAWKPLGGRKSGKGESGGDGDGDDGSGWVVQRDACPHRLAPLSEGRLETDQTIQCSYHGWRFGPEGNLALVPQLAGADPTAHARACSGGGGGARGCVAVHPSRVVDGVLWAWAEPGGGEEVARRAAAAWPPASMPPEMVAGGAADGADAAPDAAPATAPWTANSLGWYTRDVPLSAEMIVENFLDAAHVPWSHHGVMGSRDAPDQTITMNKSAAEKEKTPTRAEAAAVRGGGFTVRVQPPAGRAAYGLSFVPPGLVRYDFGGVAMLLHVTPTSPGRSRIFLTVIEPPRAQRQPASALPLTQRLGRFLASLDPRTLKNRWIPLYHATNRNAALDGDALLLYRAQELLQRGGGVVGVGGGASASAPTETTTTTTGHGVDWRRLYYMPSSADLAVAALRRWLDGPGSALPVLPANAAALGLAPPPPLSRLEVFDRYEQHTKHCPHCLRALSACNRALGFLALAGLAAFTVAVWFLAGAAMAAGGPSVAGAKAAASAGVSALCAWAASALWRLRMLFIVYDYQHAEH